MKLLSGFTVLDLGTFITAPYAAMLLAELGADVIKVERPEGGDPFRWFAGGLSSPHFQAHNRHKRSLALDYTTPRGLELLHSLIRHADALVINVRPGVEKRLGIDEATLRRLNPTARLLLHHRIRRRRPVRQPRGLRQCRPGAGGVACAPSRQQRRPRCRSCHLRRRDRHLRLPGHREFPAGADQDRDRAQSRSQHARSNACARDRAARALFRHRAGAAVLSARSDVAGLYPHLQGRPAHRAADVVSRQVLAGSRRGHRAAGSAAALSRSQEPGRELRGDRARARRDLQRPEIATNGSSGWRSTTCRLRPSAA